jgi:geranylgeranyl diphosphate synthase type II
MYLTAYTTQYLTYLEQEKFQGSPDSLYESMNYIMSLGGKRIRPILVMAGNAMAGGQSENALPIAHAMEIFHNFSLVHDDIMDESNVRRGQPTVHKKWNESTAILSGDNLLIFAYKYLLKYDGINKEQILSIFSDTAVKICEGQQFDMEFAYTNGITEHNYLKMIEYKTAVLLGCALQCGGLTAGISLEHSKLLYDLAIDIGMQFQLMDDYLDAFGDTQLTGKKSGGDIIEGKKTWLYIKSEELDSNTSKWFQELSGDARVEYVQHQWLNLKLDTLILEKSNEYKQKASHKIKVWESYGYSSEVLIEILDFLTHRKS